MSRISSRLALLSALLCLLITLAWAMFTYLNLGSDWHLFYYPITRSYISGETRLYDPLSHGWFNPPWLLPILVPFALLPEVEGLLLFRLATLAIVAYTTYQLSPQNGFRILVAVCVLMSPTVWDAIVVGNADIIVLLGLLLLERGLAKQHPWQVGLALILATIKPQLSLIPVLLLLPNIRVWPRRVLGQAAIIPLIALGLSFIISGIDWPIRYLQFIAHEDPEAINAVNNVSLYELVHRALGVHGIADSWGYLVAGLLLAGILRHSRDVSSGRDLLAIGIASSPLILPYLSTPGLALSMIAAWPRLVERRTFFLSAFVYCTQFLIVLRGNAGIGINNLFGWGIGWVLVLFSVSLTIALLLSPRRTKSVIPSVSVDSISNNC